MDYTEGSNGLDKKTKGSGGNSFVHITSKRLASGSYDDDDDDNDDDDDDDDSVVQ